MTIVLFSIVYFVTFSMGAASGAAAVGNESVTIGDVHANLTAGEYELEQTVDTNFSTAERAVFHLGGGHILTGTGFDLARIGVGWGYQNPSQAKYLNKATEPVVVVWIVGFFVNELRRARR